MSLSLYVSNRLEIVEIISIASDTGQYSYPFIVGQRSIVLLVIRFLPQTKKYCFRAFLQRMSEFFRCHLPPANSTHRIQTERLLIKCQIKQKRDKWNVAELCTYLQDSYNHIIVIKKEQSSWFWYSKSFGQPDKESASWTWWSETERIRISTHIIR